MFRLTILALIFALISRTANNTSPAEIAPPQAKEQAPKPYPDTTKPHPQPAPPVCPDCGTTYCIYESIDSACPPDATDAEILETIEGICKEKGITDPAAIDLIKCNYYL